MTDLTNDMIIAVGKAILPYLPSEISSEALGALSYDAAVALRKASVAEIPGDQQRHMAKVGRRLCDIIEELAGVEDVTPAGAEMVLRQWARGVVSGIDPTLALREAVKRVGSQKAWADQAGISPQYVTDALKGRREFGDGLLTPLGLEKVVIYRRKA